ncbi:MAG: RICIN domain-containing protein [Endozoicomonas sp.]
MSNDFYIVSKLNGNVLDVAGNNSGAGTQIISYPINSPASGNQMWERVPTGPKGPAGGQGEYYITSKLNGYVLDVRGNNDGAATPIINYPTNEPASSNQIWTIVESDQEGWFYIISQLNGYVLDIEGADQKPGAHIINYPQNKPTSDNQLWQFVKKEDAGSHKKKSFAPGKKTAFATKQP